jgi:drug/metabolite transporter (DMT)-like permease
MSSSRLIALTALTMLAFAANSVLCRVALKQTSIDATSFTTIRLISGALVLGLAARLRSGAYPSSGDWLSATALFVYAAGFSFAYLSLTAATGALLLFGAVQTTMIGHGLWQGERLSPWQVLGLVLAVGGLIGLVLPGLAAPPLAGALLMWSAGAAWGVYSLRGRGAGDPTAVTAGNFLRAIPLAVFLSLVLHGRASFDPRGFWLAVASGALSSGIGYAIWYTVLPALAATTAATVQLSVPVLAALGGILLLGEPLTARIILSSFAILGGVALVILHRQHRSRNTTVAGTHRP